jgi:hypothetical protein
MSAALLREFIDLCAVGDCDENTDALGWGDLIKRAKAELNAAARALYDATQTPKPDWDQLSEVTQGLWREKVGTPLYSKPAPIDMVLHCPQCGTQHIDAPDERTPEWKNEPHRSHLCHNPACGCIWRPADVPTNGVLAVKTRGKADTWQGVA